MKKRELLSIRWCSHFKLLNFEAWASTSRPIYKSFYKLKIATSCRGEPKLRVDQRMRIYFYYKQEGKKDLVQMLYQHIITIRLQAERKKQ